MIWLQITGTFPISDVFEEFLSPAMAAQTVLYNSSSKRKQVLNNVVEFCMQVLTGQKGTVTDRQKDGILHMLGALSSILLKVCEYLRIYTLYL